VEMLGYLGMTVTNKNTIYKGKEQNKFMKSMPTCNLEYYVFSLLSRIILN
jgi:hypothetical protein